MKRNAIARIFIYSIVAIALICALIAGFNPNSYIMVFHLGSNSITVDGEMALDATQVKNLEINWAAGGVEIRTAETDKITISEVIPDGCKHKLAYHLDGDTLELDYGNRFLFGNMGMPEKTLIITVPQNWVCEEIEIDGASLAIDIDGVTVGKLSMDGASCNLNFTGSVDQVDIDGAYTTMHLVCTNRISAIQIDGASCNLELTLPNDCGFLADMNGFSCNLHTELPYATKNGYHVYGDEHCNISVNGASCDVTIKEAP